MSVIKPNRKESDFKVITMSFEIRRELTTYVLRDFAIDGKLDYMEQFFLDDERREILQDVRSASACLEMANSIYITCMREYEERRIWQEKALGYYNRLIQELRYVIYTLRGKINVNKYDAAIRMIYNEIGLIKAWRKSDNKHKKNLKS